MTAKQPPEPKPPFCKLFDVDGNQVAIMLRSSDRPNEEAALTMFYRPPGLGICEATIGYCDGNKAKRKFRTFTALAAKRWFQKVMQMLAEHFNQFVIE